ncbi:MAG: hypothetical protein AAGG50_19040 [Bacteroidota bacterium]
MDKKEFERIKAEEKAHLRKLRALKQQYKGVSRQKKVLDALNAMQRPDLDATYDEAMRGLTEDAALTEARLEIAMENAAEAAPKPEQLTEADREKLRKAEAAALLRQMKAEMGMPVDDAPASSEATSTRDAETDASQTDAQPERTIGRPADSGSGPGQAARRDDAATDNAPGDRTIGRRRDAT